MPSATTPTGPTGLASIAGLPAAAHEVLHRELLHIHSSLHLILLILRGPLTCPRLRATLRALETSIEQIRRSTCTTLVYTDELCSTLGLPHPIGHSTSSSTSLSSSRPPLILFPSPPSPPGMTMTTTTDPSPPHAPPSSLTHSAPPSTLTLDEEAKFSLTLSFTIPSATLPTLADFSPTEPLISAEKVLLAHCFLFSVVGSITHLLSFSSPTLLLSLSYVIFGSLATARLAPLVLIAFCHGFDIYTTLWFGTDPRSPTSCSGDASS